MAEFLSIEIGLLYMSSKFPNFIIYFPKDVKTCFKAYVYSLQENNRNDRFKVNLKKKHLQWYYFCLLCELMNSDQYGFNYFSRMGLCNFDVNKIKDEEYYVTLNWPENSIFLSC